MCDECMPQPDSVVAMCCRCKLTVVAGPHERIRCGNPSYGCGNESEFLVFETQYIKGQAR